MRILISNDDSVYAPGIHVLFQELKKVANVWVVAPLEEKSTTGHSLTLHKPLRITEVEDRMFGVSGSPADCVYIGIKEVLGGKKPDLVVSGINRGANLGQDVYYSGTVSAAREACILGIPSLAVSLSIDFDKMNRAEDKFHYRTAARIAAKLSEEMKGLAIPENTLLNLNVPDLPYDRVKGVQLARQGFRKYTGSILKRRDHRGRNYYWVGGSYAGFRNEPGTDCVSVDQHFASLTPLKLDCTDTQTLTALNRRWEPGTIFKPTERTLALQPKKRKSKTKTKAKTQKKKRTKKAKKK